MRILQSLVHTLAANPAFPAVALEYLYIAELLDGCADLERPAPTPSFLFGRVVVAMQFAIFDFGAA